MKEQLGRLVRGGGIVGEIRSLRARVDELEAEVQECRQLSMRLAEVTDLVEQLLLPMAARDEEKLAAAVENYTRSL